MSFLSAPSISVHHTDHTDYTDYTRRRGNWTAGAVQQWLAIRDHGLYRQMQCRMVALLTDANLLGETFRSLAQRRRREAIGSRFEQDFWNELKGLNAFRREQGIRGFNEVVNRNTRKVLQRAEVKAKRERLRTHSVPRKDNGPQANLTIDIRSGSSFGTIRLGENSRRAE